MATKKKVNSHIFHASHDEVSGDLQTVKYEFSSCCYIVQRELAVGPGFDCFLRSLVESLYTFRVEDIADCSIEKQVLNSISKIDDGSDEGLEVEEHEKM